jgi:molecular chaperone IbpA
MTDAWETAKTIKWHTYTPYAIGFDQVFEQLDALTQSTSYPKYNIVHEGDGKYVVELALAGYDRSELDVWTENNTLCVSGTKEKKDDREYIHKGVSSRNFTRVWKLNDDVIVKKSKFENGILSIHLEKYVPEEKRKKNFTID